jgi:cell division protein ZipA
MTELRWILLVMGLAVIAAIYVVGRRNRRTTASDAAQTLTESFVPQLDQSVRAKARAVTPLLMSNDDGMNDLPPMHADVDVIADASSVVHVPMTSIYQPVIAEPAPIASDMSTGAFIAAQAQAQRSEPTMRTVEPARTASALPPSPEMEPIPVAAPVVAKAIKKSASRKIVALRLSAGSERVDGARLKPLLEAAGLRHGKYSIYHRLHGDSAPLFSVASMVEPGTFDPYAMSGVQFPGVTIFMQLPGPIDGSEMFAQMLACARELEQGIGGLLQDERGLPLTEQRAQRLRDDVADFLHLLGHG